MTGSNSTRRLGTQKLLIFIHASGLLEQRGNRKIIVGGDETADLFGDQNASEPLLLLGGGENDIITGGSNDDLIHGGSGLDLLFGAAGDDIIFGGDDRDTLYGDEHADTLSGQGGNDTLDGGPGLSDVAVFSGSSDDYVIGRSGGVTRVTHAPTTLGPHQQLDGADTLTEIEKLRFSNGEVAASSLTNDTYYYRSGEVRVQIDPVLYEELVPVAGGENRGGFQCHAGPGKPRGVQLRVRWTFIVNHLQPQQDAAAPSSTLHFSTSVGGYSAETAGVNFFRVEDSEPVAFSDIVQALNSPEQVTVDPVHTVTVPVSQPDDHGDEPSSATLLGIGGWVTGIRETAFDQDFFAVHFEAGERYAFVVSGISKGGLSGIRTPNLTIYGPDGSEIEQSGPISGNGLPSFTSPTTDTYYLSIGSVNPYDTGGYFLSPLNVPTVVQETEPVYGIPETPGSARLDLDHVDVNREEGSPGRFEIERRDQYDGDIVVRWTVTGIGRNPADAADFVATTGLVTLRDGDRSQRFQIATIDDSVLEEDERYEVKLTLESGAATFADDDATGTILNDDGPSGAGPGDDHGNTLANSTIVPEDEWERGFIETVGDIDWFRFDLTGGARYDIIVNGDNDLSLIGGSSSKNATGLRDATAKLYNSAGTFIAEIPPTGGNTSYVFENSRYSLDLEGQGDGTFYLSVQENGDNDIGQYFVQADVRIGADDYPERYIDNRRD